MVLRVPFDFALMGHRYRPFVEGRRHVFLMRLQLIGEQNRFKAVCNALVAAFFLCLGASGLSHDFSVEWNTVEAVITQVVPMLKKDRFDWWYLYSFKTESGQNAQGKIVLIKGIGFRRATGFRWSMCETNLKTIGMPTIRCPAAFYTGF
jgi:hypothetical protein